MRKSWPLKIRDYKHPLLPIIILALLMLIIGISIYIYTSEEIPVPGYMMMSRPVENSYAAAPAKTPIVINFDKIGNITINNPGQKKDMPYLIYEKPGNPAISQKFAVSNNTTCKANGAEASCAIKNGQRVRIIGNLNKQELEALLIEFL